MSILEVIKEKIRCNSCDHIFEIRYDERFNDEDEKYHTYKIEECVKCGMVKSIEIVD